MNDIVEYVLVAECWGVFEKTVNEYLSKGYELYGNHSITIREDSPTLFSQALIKRKSK